MTYNLLKYPWIIFKNLIAVMALPIIIIACLFMSDSFKDFCDGIDRWFIIMNQD